MAIDKNELYGMFNASANRQARLQERIVSKALDLPLCEGVNVTTHNQGAGLLKTATVCVGLLAAGAGGTALVGLLSGFVSRSPSTPMEGQQYEVRFWADDGTQLDVQESANDGESR